MKSLILTLFLALPLLSFSQRELSTDKFIRIVGQAQQELQSSGLEINFTLSEIQGNEYKQILPKSIGEVVQNFKTSLKANGVDLSKMKEDSFSNIGSSRYSQLKSKNYKMVVKSEEEAAAIAKSTVDGFKMGNISYIYESNIRDYENEMSVAAIKDAKRKAESIAKAVGKSVGELLNIEDLKNTNQRGSNSKSGSKSASKTITYMVNVTFELI
jgi:uncharacterized protein YggE